MGARVPITAQQRTQVEHLAFCGLRDQDICIIVGLKESTLRRHCRKELDIGRAKGKGKLSQTAMQMATSGKHPAMTIFMSKVRLGWRETEDNDPGEKKGLRVFNVTVTPGPTSE